MAHKFRGMLGIHTDGPDVTPNELVLTTYNGPHLVTYWRLLDADDDEKWSERLLAAGHDDIRGGSCPFILALKGV
ncbi:hypothetical protein NLM27_26885 [Bradyrhizobium sp. CCGB12]|uniref:hypothetical protein n=1 Tax=Bradyrhizobium sp. CCGB12 TaxID=2949632 RepID=UPI0020B17EFF|nr:hypothetical protein [Bradyrhizobium sp. CCGB12]MCP3392376.1 hypothetical protein [Bradyrhizobium sp. CCGB12]